MFMEQTKTTGQRLSSVSKKAISLLLSLIMLFSITAGIDFSAFAAGGSSDLIYGSTTTRAQWLHNLVITFDMYVDKNEYPDNYFSDLSETHMFYDDIITAVNFGVVDIEAGEELRPDAAATREFAAHTLNFCLGFQLDEAAGYTFSDSASCEYPDDNQIAVNRAWVKLSSGKFNPSVNLTLAEAKAMLTDAKSVLEDSVIDENYDSAWNVSNGIIEVPEYADVAVDGNKVTIVNSPVTIKTGNKFVVYSGGIGLPFTAKSVSISGNTTTITTTDLDPDQAFDAVDAEGVIDSDEIIFSPADDSVSLEVEETYGNAASAYSSRKTQKQQNAILDTEIDFGNGAKAKIKGKFSNIKVTYRIFDGSGEASANVEGDLDVTCTASISGSVIGKGNAQLLNCTIPGIGGLTITFDVTAAGTASCHSKSHVSFGIACSMKNGFRILKSFQEKSSRLNAEAETNMGLQLKFGVTQMPALSAYVYADTGLNAKASVSTFNDGKTPKKCTTFMAYLYARYGAHASSRFVKKAYNKTETVYDKNNSPVRVYHHYEDNKEVSKCTRGNAGFKYYTKYNSRYASSGWYGGMGTYGLDDTGIQIPIWEYTLNDEQEATITKYNGNAGSVYIPETLDGYTVVALGDGLFRNKTNMYAVEIPNTVTKIGSYVFDNTGLTSLVLPDTLTDMGDGSFYNCKSLKSIKLPNCRVNISKNMFFGCESLESISLPDTVQYIRSGAFENSGLKTVKLPAKVELIEWNAFKGSALSSITFSGKETSIGDNAFQNCDNLKSVSIPNSVSSIGRYAFQDCDKLVNISLGTGLTEIPEYSFEHCDVLSKIVLPYRISSISKNAFANCVALTEITIPRATENIETAVFSYPEKMTIKGVSGTYAAAYAKSNGIRFVNNEVKATAVSFNKSGITINKGSSERLIMNVTPSAFTDAVSWKSTNTNVATIDDSGLVTAKGVGTATIKVTVGNVSTSCKVTVVQPVTSISLNATNVMIETANWYYKLEASVYPSEAANKTVKWNSSNENVATVTQDGTVTGKSKGTAVITVTAQDGSNVSKTCNVTVKNNEYRVTDFNKLESPHNYANNCGDYWSYSDNNASQLNITFDKRTSVEENFDYLLIYNHDWDVVGKYTGTELAGKTITVQGKTVRIQLLSDDGGNEWGFKVTNINSTHKHTWDAGKITKQPTSTATGIKTYTCTKCKATKTETLPVTRLQTPTAKAVVNANGGFTISWNKIDGADKYDVYIDNGAGYKLLRTVTGTSTTTGTAVYGKKYAYKVRAVNSKNSAVTSAFSIAVTATNTKKLQTPSAKATVNANGSFTISWNKVPGATRYGIYMLEANGKYKWIKSTNATSWTTGTAQYGKKYTYKVFAVNDNNKTADSNFSSPFSATNNKKLQTPSLKVAVNKNGSFKLSWGKVTGATSYQLYIKQADGSYKLMKTTSSTSFTTAVAAKGKTYSYKIKAVTSKNKNANSNYSNTVSAKRK